MNSNIFKILLVDDEEKTRNLIKLCIDWNAIGCQICGEAEGGQEALDLLEELEVDLVLTDIEMPYMNGLELAKNIVKRCPQVKIAVLTAHESFHYAKESIHIGVCEYIVKPIKREYLKNTILKIKDQKQKEEAGFERYQEEIENNLLPLKNSFLNDAVCGKKSFEYIKTKADLYGIAFDFSCSKIRVAIIILLENDETEEVRNLIMHLNLKEIIKSCVGKKDECELYTDYFGRSTLLLAGDEVESYTLIHKVAECLKQKNYGFCIGVGAGVSEWKDAKFSYENALEALKHKIIYGKDSIIYYEQLVLGEGIDKSDSERVIGEICFYTKIGDLEKAFQKIQNLFQQYVGISSITNARFDAINCVIQLMKVITDLGFDVNKFFRTSEVSFKHIAAIDNIPMLKNYLMNIVGYMIDSIKSYRTTQNRSLIVQIKSYLEENYQDHEISLIRVAEKYYVNQSFLSRIFKQETTVNFVTYLTKIRINKAIELLSTGEYKIYEIAEMVGIPDANYFPKCFKKITGMTIAEYKKPIQ